MLRAFLVLLVLIATASPCVAGVGHIGVYADAGGNDCFLFSNGGGTLVFTYVVHNFLPGDEATASRFAIEGPSAWTFLSFQSAFPGIPGAQADIAVSYGACMTTKTTVGTALWLATSAPPSCSFVTLKPADSMPTIIIADCTFAELAGGFTSPLYVNPTLECDCIGATQPSTWGAVKALYR